MEFSESNSLWGPLPNWVSFFVELGRSWPRVQAGERRICLISTPCDSQAAGLIALGALIRDLETPSANDIDAHYDSLLRYARQYLKACEPCELEKCNPSEKRCGYSARVSGRLRLAANNQRAAIVSKDTDFDGRQLAWKEDNAICKPTPRGALNWHIDGHPPVQIHETAHALSGEFYRQIVSNSKIQEENLMRSYSGLCFAGRTAGELQSQEVCSSIRFRSGQSETTLNELLTIFDWTSCKVSRVTFYNSRTERFDREPTGISLVVADGGDCFLRICGSDRFQQSDIIGVAHRNAERDKLEALGDKITSLKQWLMPDEDTLLGLPPIPMGVSLTILKRRVC